jgi:hypothetical protein
MLSASSLLRLPYDASLTLAGIEYAKKSLHYTYNRMRLKLDARLRKIVAGVAVELAFQRWLDANAVPYDRLGLTAFTEKDKYDLALGGRRCDLKSFFVTDRDKITLMRRDPAILLDATALVPDDQFRGESLGENDFYLFGFLAGLETRRAEDLEKAARADQPLYLLYTLNESAWLGEPTWRSLGRLALKANTRGSLEVEIGGQDEKRAALVERLWLEPRTRAETQNEFYSLLYVHPTRQPKNTVGVRSNPLKDTRLIEPGDWANIWVYGIEIVLTGWMTKGDFRKQSQRLPSGSPVWQYPRTQTDNRALPVRELRPIEELVALVKNSDWGKRVNRSA